METTATLNELLQTLERGDLLLLPNSPAAKEMRSAYDAQQRARGHTAWQPARAISWQQWTSSLYSDLIVNGVETRLLLNAAQEQSLWRAVLDDDPPTGMLISTDSLAELAASGFQLAAAWNATARLSAAASSDDTRTFARWAKAFEERCTKEKCLSPSMLDAALAQHIDASKLVPPPTLQLVGFVDLVPSQKRLLEVLEKKNTDVARVELVAEGAVKLHAAMVAANPRAEMQLAARWLRQQLSEKPAMRIGVLVPGLDGERAELESVLRETLSPELQSITEDLSSSPWEISSGVPLSSLAMIADALDIARWAITSLPQPRISALLLSPYLNPGVEREYAAHVDARLRRKEKRLRSEFSLDAFTKLLERHGSEVAWPRRLALGLARAGDVTKPRSYADWMDLLRRLVQATGWPSSDTRALNATEFEVSRAWESVLDLVATLDFSGKRVQLSEAFAALERQAQATTFTSPATNAPIQIMRPSEIEGAVFDAVLFLHATDANLPAAQVTHPLLSWALQSSLGMPGTDPVRAAAQARKSIQALLERTRSVLFLTAAEDADGHLRPSPLLAELGLPYLDAATLGDAEPARLIDYELVADSQHLPPLPRQEVKGGARVLQLQAACGFRAFAELRLNAGEPDTAEIGLDARQSGSLMHRVLDQFWTHIKSQDELVALNSTERRELLELCIDAAMRADQAPHGAQWDQAYLSVIRERLLRLMNAWLNFELARAPFLVLETETKKNIEVGPIKLDVRVDRIDMVQDGRVLIDYKTGSSAHPRQWGIPRPEEPQLPLYAMLFPPEDVKGIAFAKLIVGEGMRWHGMQSEAGILPSGKRGDKIEDLALRMEEWRAELEHLAHAFADGDAEVAPKDPIATCQYCAQRILCRVSELHLTITSDDEEGAGIE